MKPALGPASAFLGPVHSAWRAHGTAPESPLDRGLRVDEAAFARGRTCGLRDRLVVRPAAPCLKETGPHLCGPVSRFWGGGAAMRYVA